jgi:rhodanese-related sulfurtransferase
MSASAEPDPDLTDPDLTDPDPTERDPTARDPTEPDPTAIDIDPDQVAGWLARDPRLQVVDVRERYERDAGYIDGSRHIELVRLSDRAGELDRERAIVFYCRVGARSEMAAQAFRAAGVRAHSMSGGLVRWAAEGRPLAPEGGEVAEH